MILLANLLKNIILLLHWIEFIWQSYLNRRQFIKVRQTEELPREIHNIMPQQIFTATKTYNMEELDFHLAKSVVSVISSSLLIREDNIAKIWKYACNIDPFESEIFRSCIWITIMSALNSLVDLPFDLYNNFVLEKNLGLPIASLQDLLTEWFLGFLTIILMAAIITSIILNVIRLAGLQSYNLLWIIFCISLSNFYNFVHIIGYPRNPGLIDFPMCNLKQRIESLCGLLNFPLEKIELLVETPVMAEHRCVYYYGISRKTIVISLKVLPAPDLPNSLDEEEVLALVAHELGHWFNKHDIKQFIILQTVFLAWFSAFFLIFERKIVYEAFGFHEPMPLLIGFLVVLRYVMMPFNLLSTYVLKFWSHKHEYEADDFAVSFGLKAALKRALIKIHVVNFQFIVVDSLYSEHNYRIPTLLERLHHLNQIPSVDSFFVQ